MSRPHRSHDTKWGRLRHLAAHLALDITPLRRSRDFRLLYAGEIITVTGAQVTMVALLFQLFDITGSPAAVGIVGLFEFVPLMIGTIVGGPLIDRYDRRRILLLTQVLLACSSIVLLASTFAATPPLWILYGAAAAASLISGIDVPTRSAMTPNLVGKDQVPAAVALTTTMWSVSSIIGPALGGLLVGTLGVAWAYTLDLATYAVALVLMFLIRTSGREPASGSEGNAAAGPPVDPPEGTWASIKEGLLYLKGRRVLRASFIIDIIAMTFGLPAVLFPILASIQFGRGPEVAGFLFAAVAAGGLIASLTSGWTGRVRHQGKAVVVSVVIWGGAIAAFGLIGDQLWLGLLLLALAGGADVISAVFRGVILQSSVPDRLRGRLTSIHFLVVAGGPRLGYVEGGIVAQIFTPLISVVSGGLITIAGAVLLVAAVPAFWRYHAGEET